MVAISTMLTREDLLSLRALPAAPRFLGTFLGRRIAVIRQMIPTAFRNSTSETMAANRLSTIKRIGRVALFAMKAACSILRSPERFIQRGLNEHLLQEPAFRCPIGGSPLEHPMITNYGYSYDRSCNLTPGDLDPTERLPISFIRENRTLQNVLDDVRADKPPALIMRDNTLPPHQGILFGIRSRNFTLEAVRDALREAS